MGFVLLLLIFGFALLNGVVMAYDPWLWTRKANQVNRFMSRGRPWFEYSAEGLEGKAGVLLMRISGVLMAVLSLAAIATIARRLLGLWVLGPGHVPEVLGYQERDRVPSSVVSLVGYLFLVFWVCWSVSLAIAPRRTLRTFGMSKWITARDEHMWVFRVVGAGIAAMLLRALLWS